MQIYKIGDTNIIPFFIGNYGFLSNFYSSQVTISNVWYPTVEHAYQAAKTLDLNWRYKIENCQSPGLAKRIGKLVPVRENWDEIKLTIMNYLLIQKFSYYKELENWLIGTFNKTLVEGNYWGDKFWGCAWNKEKEVLEGENNLGKLLMKIRDSKL